MQNNTVNDSCRFSFSKQLYSKDALIKSAYAFTDRAYVHLDSDSDNYIVSISAKADQLVEFKEFENEMLAQMARHIVYEQTKDIRRLTVARAFATTIIGQTNEMDVVDNDSDIDDVMKNWFDE